MAISGANWASATDPFIMALDHAFTGTVGELSNNRIRLQNSEGFISGVVDERDIQEIYWSKDTDKEITWFVNAMETQGLGPHSDLREIGKHQERSGSSFISFRPTDYFEADTKDALIYTTGKSAGAVKYSLFAYTAFTWLEKDPAQILFSWIAHHTNSAFTMKDFLNQTSFQDASDYYDENPINLSLWREVGSSISDQVKKVINHTADFISVRPAESGGAMQLHIMPRLAGLTTRTTAVDLDSKSVQDYMIRPTDRYTLDRLNTTLGGAFSMVSSGDPDDPGDYVFSRPLDLPGKNRVSLSQKVGAVGADRTLDTDAPYHTTRGSILDHLDINYWEKDQDELFVDFADWSHLNFEAGDLVPITGGKAGYSNDLFLVTEKTVDNDSMLASVRFLQLKGLAGKRPRYADQANLVLSLVPNSLGDYFDGTSVFPKDLFLSDDPRNLDRVWDLSNNYAHVAEMPRGAPPAANLQVDTELRGRWPALQNDGTMGGDFPVVSSDFSGVSTPAASNLTFYCVLNLTDTVATSTIFSQNGILVIYATRSGFVEYFDGLHKGTAASVTGWQILTFVLDSTGSSIRRNGVDLDTGLAYTPARLLNTANQGFLVSAGGDLAHFNGDFAEMHIFDGAHSGATVDLIEAHLAEKYDITI